MDFTASYYENFIVLERALRAQLAITFSATNSIIPGTYSATDVSGSGLAAAEVEIAKHQPSSGSCLIEQAVFGDLQSLIGAINWSSIFYIEWGSSGLRVNDYVFGGAYGSYVPVSDTTLEIVGGLVSDGGSMHTVDQVLIKHLTILGSLFAQLWTENATGGHIDNSQIVGSAPTFIGNIVMPQTFLFLTYSTLLKLEEVASGAVTTYNNMSGPAK